MPGNIIIDIEKDLTLVNSGSISNFVGEDAIIPEGENSIIQINTGSLFIGENSSISSFSFGTGNGGDIFIDVDEAFDVVSGLILTSLFAGAEGKAGDIDVNAGSLSLKDGAFFESSTSGKGDSGKISISTEGVVTLSSAGTFISNIVAAGAVGNSQGISIAAESLYINNGAQIQTLVEGASENNPAGIGNGGNIDINIRDGVNLSGIGINSAGTILRSLISSELRTGATGKAGDINIKASSIFLDNGARLSTSSGGQGDAGNITFDIQDTVNLSGFAFNSDETIIFSTSVRSALEAAAEGNAGDINVTASSISLENGAILNNSSFGKGNAGNITCIAKTRGSVINYSSIF